MKQQQILNFKQQNQFLEVFKKIAKQATDNVPTPKHYYCKVIQVYNDVYADCVLETGSVSTTFSHMVNKSGVILNIGDLVLLTAPMGDLSDMYIDKNQSTDVHTNAEKITGILKIGGKNNSSGLIQILNGSSDVPSMELSGYSIDFYDFLQTGLKIGAIVTDRDIDLTGNKTGSPSLSAIIERGCSFKVTMKNADGLTCIDALVVNNNAKDNVRNFNINLPTNFYPGDTSDVGLEITPEGTRLFGDTDFELGNATRVNSLDCVNLEVSGTKNCKQSTKNFGDRLFCSYEFGDNFLGDVGYGVINNGECVIAINSIIAESINLDEDYIVKFYPDESCNYKITKTPTYFVINSDKNIGFGWEIMGRRRGFENQRLEYAKNITSVINKSNTRNILLDSLNNDDTDLLNKSLFKELDNN